MTPTTRQTGDAVIRLNALATLGAATIAITIDPMVKHVTATFGLFRFHVGRDARRWGTLNASFVHGVFAHCGILRSLFQ